MWGGAKRLWHGVPREATVHADMSGGIVEVVKLTDNGVPKVLLRHQKNGVLVEMALPPAVAQDLIGEMNEALLWARLPDAEREARG